MCIPSLQAGKWSSWITQTNFNSPFSCQTIFTLLPNWMLMKWLDSLILLAFSLPIYLALKLGNGFISICRPRQNVWWLSSYTFSEATWLYAYLFQYRQSSLIILPGISIGKCHSHKTWHPMTVPLSSRTSSHFHLLLLKKSPWIIKWGCYMFVIFDPLPASPLTLVGYEQRKLQMATAGHYDHNNYKLLVASTTYLAPS